jgi:hypothetical protein
MANDQLQHDDDASDSSKDEAQVLNDEGIDDDQSDVDVGRM